jgi:hypothetical protein
MHTRERGRGKWAGQGEGCGTQDRPGQPCFINRTIDCIGIDGDYDQRGRAVLAGILEPSHRLAAKRRLLKVFARP